MGSSAPEPGPREYPRGSLRSAVDPPPAARRTPAVRVAQIGPLWALVAACADRLVSADETETLACAAHWCPPCAPTIPSAVSVDDRLERLGHHAVEIELGVELLVHLAHHRSATCTRG